MSRIGRLPVEIPGGVDVTINGREVSVKGPKGSLALELAAPIEISREDGTLKVTRPNDEGKVRALHGWWPTW
jgi:large subunit ribosomal protein L6